MEKQPICMIPGPTEYHEEVLQAYQTPALSHNDPFFVQCFSSALKLLRHVFQASVNKL